MTQIAKIFAKTLNAPDLGMTSELTRSSNQSIGFSQILLAGAFSGTIVDVSLFPIDTIKTRLQSTQGFIAAGGFRGIYSGVGSVITGSAPSAALFFITYEFTKRHLCNVEDASTDPLNENAQSNGPHRHDALEHMIAASLGEIAACAVRVPTEVVKQRAQASEPYSSISVLKDILGKRHGVGRSFGFSELYRGWSITIFREVPFTIIQFPLWELLKKRRNAAKNKKRSSAIESAVFGSISGAIAAFATTPLDVLKTRMMLSVERQRLVPLAQQMLRENGFRTFFAGVVPRIAWISAGGAIFLGSYQWASNRLALLP